jgi:hypothetical protein
MDNFDKIYSYLTEEIGLSSEDAHYSMTKLVEQGFINPTEIILRGMAGMAGLVDMLPKKKTAEVKAPKPPKPPAQVSSRPGTPTPNAKPVVTTPKQTQGMLGSRSVPDIKQVSSKYGLDTPAPKPQFGPGSTKPIGPNPARSIFDLPRRDAGIRARNTLNRPQVSQGTVSALSTLASLARGITPSGVAAAVMAPRPTGDGTLTGALKRGDYKPMQGPPAPKAPEQKPVTKEKLSATAKDFDKTFAAARAAGKKEFIWRKKLYNTKLK